MMLKQLILNSSSNVLLLLLRFVVTFFLTPIIVQSLGNHDYGINEIVLAIIGYMGLLEIGLQPAVTRSVARYSSFNQINQLQCIFSTAIIFSTVVGLFISVILIVWALSGAIGLVPENGDSIRYVFFLCIVACQVLVSFPGNVIQCVHQGHQRYGVVNLVTAINTIIGTSIIYIFLQNGYGLLTLTLVNTIGITVKFVILAFLLLKNRYGNYRLRISFFKRQSLGELITFGGKSFVLGIASSFSRRASPIIIGSFINPNMVIFYVIPFNLIGQFLDLISTATLNFMPYFSNLHAQGNIQKVKDVFVFSSRYMVGLSICGFLNVFFLGPIFLKIWINTEFAQYSTSIVYIATTWAFLKGLNPFHGRILTGMDLHGSLAKLRIIEAILFFLISLILVHYLELKGVALSVLIAALIVEPMILRLVCQQINYNFFEYFMKVIFPCLLPCFILVCFFWFVLQEFTFSGYLALIGAALIGSFLYILIFLLVAVSKDERQKGIRAINNILLYIVQNNFSRK